LCSQLYLSGQIKSKTQKEPSEDKKSIRTKKHEKGHQPKAKGRVLERFKA